MYIPTLDQNFKNNICQNGNELNYNSLKQPMSYASHWFQKYMYYSFEKCIYKSYLFIYIFFYSFTFFVFNYVEYMKLTHFTCMYVYILKTFMFVSNILLSAK